MDIFQRPYGFAPFDLGQSGAVAFATAPFFFLGVHVVELIHLYWDLPWKTNPNGAKIFLKRDTGIIGPLDFKMLEKTLHDCTVIKVPCS